MLKIGFAEAFAYRAEMLVWIASTSMPLIMLGLWSAVAREGPMGRFGHHDFVAYFVAMFIVRQLTGSWSAWLINMEVRDGTLALRMLRPVHPLLSYAASSFAELPVRCVLAVPLAAIALFALAGDRITHDPVLWVLWIVSIAGGWLITLLANFAIGCLALFLEQSTKLLDVWLVLFFVFSGYTVPVELFPDTLRQIVDFLPFRYQLGLPVEIMIGAHDHAAAIALIARQWAIVAVMLGIVTLVWRRGVRRFAAFGG
jgi:ABC-2 type transport system permease protein